MYKRVPKEEKNRRLRTQRKYLSKLMPSMPASDLEEWSKIIGVRYAAVRERVRKGILVPLRSY